MARHGDMAEQLAPLRYAINRPVSPIEPAQTNWTTLAANDNNPEDLADKRVERRWAIRPTEDEIMREVKDAEVVCDKDGRILSGNICRGDDGQIVAIGKLRFSDGTQRERAFTYGPEGKVIMFDALMPVGAMLGTKDKQERMLGGDGATCSNAPYTAVYGGRHPTSAARRKRIDPSDGEEPQPKPVRMSKEAMRAEIAMAIARTPKVPPVRRGGKGFPWQPAKLRDLFMGFEKGRKGETGSIAWQDISSHIVEREVWHETIVALAAEDKDALAKLETARSVADLAPGTPKRTATRQGKTRLFALNDNIDAAYKKSAA